MLGGIPGKICCLRDPADVIGFQCELNDLSEIHDLREAGVEILILPELFLVRECVGQVIRPDPMVITSRRCLSIA